MERTLAEFTWWQFHGPSRQDGNLTYLRSLRGRLSVLFSVMFATILLLGVASGWSLGHSNEVATDVRNRWLPDIRFLGDLNNFTSDYRTAEANSLLAANASELARSLHEIQVLDQEVKRAKQGYEQLRHGKEETDLYQQFSATWTRYKALADQVTALSSEGRIRDAAVIYRIESRTTYDAASDLLGKLTDYNVVLAGKASERSAAAYDQARWLMGITLVLAGVMLIVVIYNVQHSVSFPMLDLGRAMRQLATNDTAVEIGHTHRMDEIGEMARAVVVFRANAIELMHSQRGLAQQATMLEEKLFHEQSVTQLQRNFVSTITHEFRTPLTQIDAQAQRLINLKDRLLPEDLNDRSNRIRAAVTRIIRMIDTLVETTRLMDGDASLFFHPESIDLAVVLRNVSRVHREISPGVQIQEDYGAQSLLIWGDPKLLFQAFSNLLANAIKYSVATANVAIRAEQTGTQIAVIVEDSGIGIPKRDRDHIFERYYRGDNVSGFVGTGIGLFLVATVITLHAGAVAVESEEGVGSRFTVTLNRDRQ
jgi:two-component system, OmpR family, sensor kinase